MNGEQGSGKAGNEDGRREAVDHDVWDGALHSAALGAGPKMSGLRSWREMPECASTSSTLPAGTRPRLRQFTITLGLSMPSAVAAFVGPPRASIARSTVEGMVFIRQRISRCVNFSQAPTCYFISRREYANRGHG